MKPWCALLAEWSEIWIGGHAVFGCEPRHEITATLNDSLMGWLDRLGPAREIAQVGAAIGTEFPYELICAVVSTRKTELQTALERLTEAELL